MELSASLNKYKNIVMNLALIILAVIVSGNIYKRQSADLASINRNIAEEKKKNKVFDNLGKLEKKIDAYKKVLPGEEATTVINVLNAIAKDFNVRITSIRPAPEERKDDYTKSAFQLNIVVSGYQALGRFISALENHPIFFVVEGVGINSDRQTQDMNVSLVVSKIAFRE